MNATQSRKAGSRRYLLELPQYIRADGHELEVVESHHDDGQPAEGDVFLVDWRENIERLAACWKVLPAGKRDGDSMPVELEADLRHHAEDNQLGQAPVERVQHGVARTCYDEWQHPLLPDVGHHVPERHRHVNGRRSGGRLPPRFRIPFTHT